MLRPTSRTIGCASWQAATRDLVARRLAGLDALAAAPGEHVLEAGGALGGR